MGRMFLAFKTFFRLLGNAELADCIQQFDSTQDKALPAPEAKPAPIVKAEPPKPTRSDAISLLEALQREARLIDFLQEDITSYSDAQVGAAVREVHRGCADVLMRTFEIGPIESTPEGTQRSVTTNDNSARIRLTGQVTETRPVSGELVHAGWIAKKCALPKWNGTEQDALVIAPAEVEIR